MPDDMLMLLVNATTSVHYESCASLLSETSNVSVPWKLSDLFLSQRLFKKKKNSNPAHTLTPSRTAWARLELLK